MEVRWETQTSSLLADFSLFLAFFIKKKKKKSDFLSVYFTGASSLSAPEAALSVQKKLQQQSIGSFAVRRSPHCDTLHTDSRCRLLGREKKK